MITTPDLLTDAPVFGTTEVFIDVSTRRIRLTTCGHLTSAGVTLQALYSFLKEQWFYDPHGKKLPGLRFPIQWIVDNDTQCAELVGGWDFYDDATRHLIREGTWRVVAHSTRSTSHLDDLPAIDVVAAQKVMRRTINNERLGAAVRAAMAAMPPMTNDQRAWHVYVAALAAMQKETP